MQEVIARVVEAETGARRIVEAARAEADHILSTARDDARELSTRIRHDTRAETERIVEDSVRASQQDKQARLAQYAAELETRLPLGPATQQQAVTAALEIVCIPE